MEYVQYHFGKGIQMSIYPQSFMIFYQHGNPECAERMTKPPFHIPHGVNNHENNIGAFKLAMPF